MNLENTRASNLTSSLNRPRNIYTVNDHATSSSASVGGVGEGCQNEKRQPQRFLGRRRRFQKRRQRSSFGSTASSSSSISKSTITESEPGLFLYEITSQNCPCEHHRSARLRESRSQSKLISDDNEDFIDSFIVNNFEASVAPMRGFLTSTSSNGDSGINTNSNGSQRSSARGYYDDSNSATRSSRAFSLSSSSSSSAAASDDNENDEAGDKEVTTTTTTVILEHEGCEDDLKEQHKKQQQSWCWQEHENNKAATNTNSQKNTKPFQISPENDPANNWTLIKVNNNGITQGGSEQMTSIQEEEYDSLFSSSLKTSHSSSHKELCTCLGGQISDQDLPQQRGHRLLTRMASYPKCHPDLDPHRYDLERKEDSNNLEAAQAVSVVGLRQLPTIPPSSYFWQPKQQQSNTQPRRSLASTPTSDFHKRPSRTFSHNSFSAISTSPDMIHILDVEAAGSNEIPPCVRDVILQQLQSPRPPTNPKMMRKLSKTINLPDDPSDPTAFTVFHDHPMYYNVPKYKSRSKRSRQVAKIVGTFSFLMTMGIVITVLCFLYWSDIFKPMTMM